MKRVFKIDVHHCPYCGDRLRFVAVIFDPTAIQAIIAAVHLADERAEEARPQATSRGPPGCASRGPGIVPAPLSMRQAT